jgi:uncharacterized protein YqjF (DUF2071 family)
MKNGVSGPIDHSHVVPVIHPTLEQRLAAREMPNGWPVMRQRWADLLFLHWPIDSALLRARLPAGLHVDTYEGNAWIGVVPFSMQRVRPVGLLPLPWLSWFLELNVRTYVRDEFGNPGVWFFSLSCNQPLAVEIARRAFHLPYEHAVMDRSRTDGQIQYSCHRKLHGAIAAAFEYTGANETQQAKPRSLEWFLVERYLLFCANRDGRLFCGRVHHEPYQIATGGCTKWSVEPLRLDGFPTPSGPPESILTAAPVDVKIFPLREVQR